MPDSRTVPELVKALIVSVRLRAEAMDKGDSRAANAFFDQKSRIGLELLRRPPAGHTAILTMLDDEDVDVRMNAAFLGLEIDPERSLKVIEELSKTQTKWRGVSAEMVLHQWKSGKLKLLSKWSAIAKSNSEM